MDAHRTQEMTIECPFITSKAALPILDPMKTELALDDEFDRVTDELSRFTLDSTLMEIDGMILDEQWEKKGVEGSRWEQALVKHKGELKQGLDQLKERSASSGKEDSMLIDVTEIPSIVVQEPNAGDDTKMACAFEGPGSSPQKVDVEMSISPQTLPASLILQEMFDEDDSFTITAFLSEEEASEYLLSLEAFEVDPLKVKNFSPSLREKLQESDKDFEYMIKISSIEIKMKGPAISPETPEEASSSIDSSVNVADPASNTESVAPESTQAIESNITEVARGTKRGSDEAGLDEKGTCKQVTSEEGDSVSTSQKERQETGDRISDSSPMEPPPKTPTKGKAPSKKLKSKASAIRRSERRRYH